MEGDLSDLLEEMDDLLVRVIKLRKAVQDIIAEEGEQQDDRAYD